MTGPIFDTHAHYSARAFDADRFALLDSLPENSVGKVQKNVLRENAAKIFTRIA